MELSEYHIAIILLAAGRGARMGNDSPPKLLLPLEDGRPILRHAAEAALALKPSEMIVVVRPDILALEESLAGLSIKLVRNARYKDGMGTSLAAGVRSLPGSTQAVLVMLGDEPAVPPQIVNSLIDVYLRERKAITVPTYGGQLGPPTLFARSLFSELSALEGDTGGRQLIASHPDLVCRVPFPEQARPRDIDTSDDYNSLVRKARNATTDDGRRTTDDTIERKT